MHEPVSKGPWRLLLNWAQAEVAATIRNLPESLRQAALGLPVTYELAPSADLVREGIEPDTLGLFVGPSYSEQSSDSVPAQILLFLENIWETAAGEESLFREEIRTTYLHELGHYLGLDEQDLFDRGLD